MRRDVGQSSDAARLLDALWAGMQERPGVPLRSIAADPWIISSLLQKSIRRGEVEIAHRAALTLHKYRGSAIWRRLVIIAFEDVGIGGIDELLTTVAAAADSAWRKSHGGDAELAVYIAGLLATAPKDRSADHLAGARDHPGLSAVARTMAASKQSRFALVRDIAAPLPQRAIAAVLSSGLASEAKEQAGRGQFEALLTAFEELGAPETLVSAAGLAAAKTREPIALMVPLIWLAANEGAYAKVQDCHVPPLVCNEGVPLYGLDEHTRLGREAIWRFARENTPLRACLQRFVPETRWRRAANVAAFYADAAPVARRLVWDQSDRLEAFGIERDLLLAGVPQTGIKPLLEAVRANLRHLNQVRAEVLIRSRAQPSMRLHRGHRS